jgi:hypothetical protein
VAADEDELDVFGPIGAAPSVDVELPEGHSEMTGELMTTSAVSTRIPGGVLLSIGSNSNGYFPGGMLAAIDHDGTVRWVRCFDEFVRSVLVASTNSAPTEALVGWLVPSDAVLWAYEWSVLSLADGTITRSLDDVIAASGISSTVVAATPVASGGSIAVLGSDPESVVDVEKDRLLLVDLVEVTASQLRYPSDLEGHVAREMDVAINPDGQLLRMEFDSDLGYQLPTALEVDGSWVTDATALVDAWPVTAGYSVVPPADGGWPALAAYDAAGRPVWRRDDVVLPPSEGFQAGVDGDVVVAESCVSGDETEVRPCKLGGYSLVDGKTLWQLDGYNGAVALGDGVAMVSTPIEASEIDPWMLIDTDTGEIAATDQHWDDPDAFVTECCGGDEFFRVSRHGGVLVVFSDRFVRIWHPRAMAHPTVSLALG